MKKKNNEPNEQNARDEKQAIIKKDVAVLIKKHNISDLVFAVTSGNLITSYMKGTRTGVVGLTTLLKDTLQDRTSIQMIDMDDK